MKHATIKIQYHSNEIRINSLKLRFVNTHLNRHHINYLERIANDSVASNIQMIDSLEVCLTGNQSHSNDALTHRPSWFTGNFLSLHQKKMPFNKILFHFCDVFFLFVRKQFVATKKRLYDCYNLQRF